MSFKDFPVRRLWAIRLVEAIAGQLHRPAIPLEPAGC